MMVMLGMQDWHGLMAPDLLLPRWLLPKAQCLHSRSSWNECACMHRSPQVLGKKRLHR